mmetsp:Transcript_10042/g.22378  ORF Transcript_10042/g.22378 Transcript_10042/m.22378 type:complete len:85 (-) Transcript_10042:23-277(-)
MRQRQCFELENSFWMAKTAGKRSEVNGVSRREWGTPPSEGLQPVATGTPPPPPISICGGKLWPAMSPMLLILLGLVSGREHIRF